MTIRAALMITLLAAMVAGDACAEEKTESRNWAFGWYSGPSIRYETDAGWSFTLNGKIDQGVTDETSFTRRLHDSPWSNDTEYQSTTDSDGQSYTLNFYISRPFDIGNGLSVGPVLSTGYGYNRDEREGEMEQTDLGSNSTRLDYSRVIYQTESWSIGFGIEPRFQPHPRVSLETSYRIYYTSWSWSEEAWMHDIDEHGVKTNSTYRITERDSSGWDTTTYGNFSLSMALAIYFYF